MGSSTHARTRRLWHSCNTRNVHNAALFPSSTVFVSPREAALAGTGRLVGTVARANLLARPARKCCKGTPRPRRPFALPPRGRTPRRGRPRGAGPHVGGQ
eukprot:11163757-Lingulodinium_polyedra.AAC.1